MRDTIFVSHATPEDNEFSIWIASRLEMLGYKVWLDRKCLKGGERFWNNIQKGINVAAKVLLVYSNNIVDKEGNLKQGIDDEISYAKAQAKNDKLVDFIIPLHIDDSSFDLTIGFSNLNHIYFADNWADGLKTLLEKLSDDGVPKANIGESSFQGWYENYTSNIHIHKYPQTYFSTWVKYDRLPKKFYIYHFNSPEEAQKVKELNKEFPMAIMTNAVITFESNLNLNIYPEDHMFHSKPQPPDIYMVNISELEENYVAKTEAYPSDRDKLNAFKKLMMTIWSHIMLNSGMRIYEMSGKKFAFFKPVYESKHQMIEYTKGKRGRMKRKAITGTHNHNQYIWHYALTARVSLKPVVGYEVKYHIVFSTDGIKPIEDNKKQHQLRRSKGARMFNKEWRDLLRAYLKTLCDKSGKIGCFVGYVTVPEGHDMEDEMYIELSSNPVEFNSEYDYKDPQKEMDENSVESFINEENLEDTYE